MSGPWKQLDKETLREIDAAALNKCGGDAALWFHYRALFEGEFQTRLRSKEAWVGWKRSKRLPQYKQVEAALIESWRIYVQNTLNIPRHEVAKRTHIKPNARVRESILYLPKEQQADEYCLNRALILSALRHATNKEQVARLLEERADSIRTFAASGDVGFFSSLGRLLSAPPRSSSSNYNYVHLMLSHWLTSYLWLMPEKTASDLIADWRGMKPKTAKQSATELRHFKEVKRDYKLKTHTPSLVDHIEASGRIVFTPQGKSILAPLFPSK